MKEKDRNRISKFLSLVLRHSPETIGITLDGNGWAEGADAEK
jgi:putative RNA 2'-phosphotransferase